MKTSVKCSELAVGTLAIDRDPRLSHGDGQTSTKHIEVADVSVMKYPIGGPFLNASAQPAPITVRTAHSCRYTWSDYPEATHLEATHP